jgi:hypothetical protein
MEVLIDAEGAQDAEQLIALLCIGVCVALKNGSMSLNEAENRIFSPYTMSALERLGVSERAIELIQMGTELEDVESLRPSRLTAAIDELSHKACDLLNGMSPRPVPCERWVKWPSRQSG